MPEHFNAKASFLEANNTLNNFIANEENFLMINQVSSLFAKAFKNGNTAFSCGNGGSMCDAMHFAEELSGRFRKNRQALPAIAISDPAHISCTANDYGYDFIFARFLEGLAKKGDLLLAISTSGNSKNIIEACQVAKEKGLIIIGLSGESGGELKTFSDFCFLVPTKQSDRIQEVHIKIIHTLIEGIERILFPNNYP